MSKDTNIKEDLRKVLLEAFMSVSNRTRLTILPERTYDFGGKINVENDIKHTEAYIEGLLAKDRQQLIQRIKEEVPKQYTPAEKLAGIDPSADYREGFDNCVEQVNQILETMEKNV